MNNIIVHRTIIGTCMMLICINVRACAYMYHIVVRARIYLRNIFNASSLLDCETDVKCAIDRLIDKESLSNYYRPISNISYFSLLTELSYRLSKHLFSNDLL